MTNLLSRFRATHPDAAALSASLDGRLHGDRAAELTRHADSCAACIRTLAELRAVRAALGAVPAVEPPRSFRLRYADVEAKMTPASHPPPLLRLMPAMSALAVVLFAALVGADLLSNRGGGAPSQSGGARTAAQTSIERAKVADAPAPRESAGTQAAGGAAASPPAPNAIAPNLPAAPAGTPQLGIDPQAAAGTATSPPVPNAVAPSLPAAPPGPRTADGAPGGTLSGAAASSTAAAPTGALAPSSASAPLEYLAHPMSRDDGGSRIGFRIGEAVLAALALGAGTFAIVRWLRSREARP